MPIRVALANGPEAVENATLHVLLGTAHLTRGCTLPAGAVTDLGTLELSLPVVDAAKPSRDPSNCVLPISAFSHQAALSLRCIHTGFATLAPRAVWFPDEAQREQLRKHGYVIANKMETADIVIANGHDDSIAARVRAGGTLLLLPAVKCLSILSFRTGRT